MASFLTEEISILQSPIKAAGGQGLRGQRGVISILQSPIKAIECSEAEVLLEEFQFYKVRLKRVRYGACTSPRKFQFYKVRLKLLNIK